MQNSRSHLPTGALVEARGRTWRLAGRQPFERCTLVTLQGLDTRDTGETISLLTPFDRVVARRTRTPLRLAGHRTVRRAIVDALATSHPWHGCWTAAAAALDLLPWQLEPAMAVLRGATRVLLADGVGLGKTVQAGLILAELFARGVAARALILTPAGLRAQWAHELSTRLHLDAAIIDQSGLARDAAQLPPDVSPWTVTPIAISSIDLVKRAEVVAALDRVPLDLLIVDEAHHLTPESDRAALVARLARRTPWLVLITATPHSGDARAFACLRDLGARGLGPLTIFRRTTPPHAHRSRARLVTVRTTKAEVALLAAVHEYARAIWSAHAATHAGARLLAAMLARRAASSTDALLVSLMRRQLLLAGDLTLAAPEQPSLPWEEVDEEDGNAADRVLAAPGLPRADEEHAWLERLIDLARRARPAASKVSWIARFLRRIREPVIVFSEYRDTIDSLRAHLEAHAPIVLHGGLSPVQRQDVTRAFVDGPATLLLATDAGGEGLNLQARCRTVIDVELPWNPLRLEQRIGRVDRIGQQRPVHAIHLLHAGSIEQRVLAQLHRRVQRATLPDAGDRDIETRVAESLLGGQPLPSLAAAPWPTASVPEAGDEAQRLATLRRLVGAVPTTLATSTAIPVAAETRTPRADAAPGLPSATALVSLRERILATPIHAAATEPWMTADRSTIRTHVLTRHAERAPIVNRESLHEIRVARASLKSALQHGMGSQKIAALVIIDRLLRDATFVTTDTSRASTDIPAVETYAGRVAVDGTLFVARLIVKMHRDGRRFYDHELSNLEPMVGMRKARNTAAAPDATSSGGITPSVTTSLGKRILDAALASKTTLHCVFRVMLADGQERTIGHAIVPVAIELTQPLPSDRRARRAALGAVTNDTAVRDLARAAAAATLASSRDSAQLFAQHVHARVTAEETFANGPHAVYQPALFDERAMHVAVERAAIVEIHRRALDRHAASMRAFDEADVTAPTLIGAWLSA